MSESVNGTKKTKTQKVNLRASGILVHPTSFPSPYGMGDLGAGAYDFVDFLVNGRQKLWQVLPLGPTGYGDSPYQSFSSFAGNHYLISPDELCKSGWLQEEELGDIPHFDPRAIDYGPAIEYKMKLLRKAYAGFKANATATQKGLVTKFVNKNKNWILDYALFTALKDHNGGKSWHDWSEPLAKREPAAISEMQKQLAEEIEFVNFCQFEFFRQWNAVKTYANDAGIKIIGDIPIFVAYDSADCWANPELYHLDENGLPTSVAGCPPDYFIETGQLWGNPLYNWEVHKKEGYKWWASRVSAVLGMVDIVRIDHFRGFEAYWAVPAGEETAVNGKWVKGPGKPFFTALKKELGDLPVIAEDLGEITEKVDILRKSQDFPGMKVLQFAFEPSSESTHLPINYESSQTVVYTGTHDNDTSLGWYESAPEADRDFLRRFLNVSGNDISWDLIRFAMSTNAIYSIYPIQDVMRLGSSDRMNSPGLSDGWWRFRYTEEMLDPGYASRLSYLTELFYRV